jgi:hypothetical protein
MLKKADSAKQSNFQEFPAMEIQKIGNMMHLIAKFSNGIGLTRLLKLMYLIDEASVKDIGVPVSIIEYKVAQLGPLAEEVWKELGTYNKAFEKQVNTEVHITGDTEFLLVTAIGTPDMELFSEYETLLIKNIVDKYRNVETEVIINEILHREDSPWGKIVKEQKIDFSKPGTKKISDFTIDFSSLISDSEEKLHYYQSFKNTR